MGTHQASRLSGFPYEQPTTFDCNKAHATSAPLGDLTKLNAISAVHGQERLKPPMIGSVQPSMGHLEAGAGVIGLIKRVKGNQ